LSDPQTYIYPGSFDPVTNGHLDIISRASRMCKQLIVAVGRNREKKTLFTVEERIAMLRESAARVADSAGRPGGGNIEVVSFTGLLADFARQCGASVIVKGLRAMSDFEYEFQMALLNKYLDERIETIFMMTNVQFTYLSSSAVKELALNGADISGLVPDGVQERIRFKVTSQRG
jgi:pantetheine-phosphate adenylyltransferase